MHIIEESIFKNFLIPITYENCDQVMKVILKLYHKYIQSNVKKTKKLYQRTDLAILWFFNITRYKCQLILVYLICKIASNDRMNYKHYYDN